MDLVELLKRPEGISGRIVPRLVPELEILPWRRSQVLAVQGTRARAARTS